MSYNFEFLHYVTKPPGNVVKLHQHQCYELVYYLSGSGKTSIADTNYEYKENNFMINPPETQHTEIHSEKTTLLFIGFSFHAEPIALRSGLYTGEITSSVLEILQKMRDEMIDKKSYFALRLKSLLMELIVTIGRVSSSSLTEFDDFSYFKNFLCENYTQNIDYKGLATFSGYSYHRFRHIFKDIFGTSPHQYVLKLRLMGSCKMLMETSYNISRIALENGFASESHFCRLFRREYNITPVAYRNKTY